ncbi:19899_t:CDS:1, partial [Racocetra fulgida]
DSEFYEKQLNCTIAEDGVDALDKPFHKEDEEIVEKHPDFDLDIAQFLLYVSDLVYARDSTQVLTAKLKMQVIKKTPEKCDELLREIVHLLTESDKAIRTQAKKW